MELVKTLLKETPVRFLDNIKENKDNIKTKLNMGWCLNKPGLLTANPKSIRKSIKFNIDHGINQHCLIYNVAHIENHLETLDQLQDRFNLLKTFLDNHERITGVRLSIAAIKGFYCFIEILDEPHLSDAASIRKHILSNNIRIIDVKGKWLVGINTDKGVDQPIQFEFKITGLLDLGDAI